MSETLETTTTEAVTVDINPFDDSSWVEKPEVSSDNIVMQEPTNQETAKVEDQPKVEATPATTEPETPVIDFNEYVKREFGFESVDEAKEVLKKAKETPQKEEVKFANEESEKLYKAWLEGKQDDVYNYLSNQKKIEKLLNSDINEFSAAEIIKLSIQNKNKDLSDDEVDFVFNKKFSIPAKPEQAYDETEEDYSSRLNQWEKQVQTIKKELVIEAKMAKPEIEKLKSELVLPDIQKPVNDNLPTQEDLQAAEESRRVYEQALESDFKNFNGFNVTFKDGDIEIPISYNVTEEEKVNLKQALSDFDSNEYFGARWFTEDGRPKVQDIMADKYKLENFDKILQKVANESANQMRVKMIALSSNIDLKGGGQQQTFNPQQKSESERLAEWVFSQ